MAWTTPLTAVDGVSLTAAQWNASVRDNLNFLKTAVNDRGKIKAGSTTRNSTTTLTDDPELTGIPVDSNATYRIVIHLEIASGTTPDFKFDITGPASFAFRIVGWSPVSGLFFNVDNGVVQAVSTSGGTGGNNDRFQLSGWLTTAGTAGNLALRWAQNTSDAGNTTLLAGTHILLTRFTT